MEMTHEHRTDSQGEDFGMVDKWIFDRQWTVQGSSIVITGNLKWGFSDDNQIRGLAKWLLEKGCEEFTLHYEEAGNQYIGRIECAGGRLQDHQLPEEHWYWDEHAKEDSEVSVDDIPESDYKIREIDYDNKS